ncbi:Ger(x)C family spore germination C-terminal domain-containing protein [Paenibacillus illinoisensis]|uniref:Ger(x)C family spore germination C-terminal domain-containing protein n=1 Tax=Paenibacillus illinoisensis TaxID=59845 RepID=UPI003AFA829C
MVHGRLDRSRSNWERRISSKLENDFEKLAEQQVKQILKKMQHKYKVDVGGFGENLRMM